MNPVLQLFYNAIATSFNQLASLLIKCPAKISSGNFRVREPERPTRLFEEEFKRFRVSVRAGKENRGVLAIGDERVSVRPGEEAGLLLWAGEGHTFELIESGQIFIVGSGEGDTLSYCVFRDI